METKKSNNIILKVLFCIIFAIILMIIPNTKVQAALPSTEILGGFDYDGGTGIPKNSSNIHQIGKMFCAGKGTPVSRILYGKDAAYSNRLNGNRFNEEIEYTQQDTTELEQSIAAAYFMYQSGQATKVQLQQVLWASKQWAGKKGYVKNLVLENQTVSASGTSGVPVYARAQDWANFYYNLIMESGNNSLNIDVKPKTEDELRVAVKQPERTFIQGPYEVNIVNSSGGVMNKIATQYSSSPNIGALVYNEIMGLNVGENIFQFCKIESAIATIKYTDGSTSQQIINTPSTIGNVKLLDASGTEIKFPQFGEKFYLSVPIPAAESRIVENIEVDFKIDFMKKIQGNASKYQATRINYELSNIILEKWLESKLSFSSDTADNASFWDLQKSLDSIIADLGNYQGLSNVTKPTELKAYLEAKLRKAAKDAGLELIATGDRPRFVATLMYTEPGSGNSYSSMISYIDGMDMIDELHNRIDHIYQRGINTSDDSYDDESPGLDEEGNPIPGNHHESWSYTVSNPEGENATGEGFDSEEAAQAAAQAAASELAESYVGSLLNDWSKCAWRYSWAQANPSIDEDLTSKPNVIQPGAEFELTVVVHTAAEMQIITTLTSTTSGYNICTNAEVGSTEFHLIGTNCTVELGGKVWEDVRQTKENKVNGQLDGGDKRYSGMLVDLHLGDANGPIVHSTTTNSNGEYHFAPLNALEKYTVVFTFNGQLYQQTYYKDDLSGGYSNAQEMNREGFNDKFDKIDSSPNNYNAGGWHTGYGRDVKLKDDAGNYIQNGSDALKYIDAWNAFVGFAGQNGSYSAAYGSLDSWMRGKGVGQTDRDGVIQFIKDCMISANTRQYPVYDYFVIENIDNPASQPDTEFHAGRTWNSLYTAKSDQSRNVDFGIMLRDTADLALQKDVFKTTVRVNGKTHTYMYNKKDANVDDDGTWNVEIRQSDNLYNGDYRYNREIRKSEYLYDGSIYQENGGTNVKDLQVYVTYRIVVRNQSQTYASTVNEIVDYFDQTEYEFDGTLNGNNYTPHTYKEYDSNKNVTREYINSYVGDRKGEKVRDLTITNTSTLGNGVVDTNLGNNYKPIYISGITKPNGDNRLETGELAYVYLTFKVKTHTDENGMPNRVQMDVNTSTGEAKGVGKRNIAEINGYSTYYKNGITVPDTFGHDKNVSGQKAGVLDRDSSAGNLTAKDLKDNGDIITDSDPVKNRAEDDTDKAPNIRLVFPENDNQERVITGYAFEDERNIASDKAVVGNGMYDQGETKINGITVQLVELVQEVDSDGIPTGPYLGEYVWNAKTWDGSKWVDTNSSNTSGSIRYYSGQKETLSPIICGPGATKIEGYTVNEDGRYAFKSIPAGDLFIRFIYGDTTQTTLTTSTGEGSEVTNLLNGKEVDNREGYISNNGLNAKSYNGQDYKSTAYQRNLGNNTSVNQNAGTHNGINGYLNYDNQNYSILGKGLYGPSIVNTTDGKDKGVMYYYNIGESQIYNGISDAKDVGNIRENVNYYSRGISDVDGINHQTLTNRRDEVLASGLKMSTAKNADEQVIMLKELMNNTAMIAQTGVINTEVEYNTKQTNNQGDKNVIGYVIDDVDLGLEERPVSQLKVNKEVTNVKITLANGSIMFDTNKAVTNLAFAKHTGHLEYYNTYGTGNFAYRLAQCVIGNNTAAMPELITTYMDEELMYGARLELEYAFTVTNIGEVDYLDKQFYYIGKTNNTDVSNISKTGADKVIDYISNNLQFTPTNSNNTAWSIRTVQELTERGNTEANGITNNQNNRQDLVNVKHKKALDSYNNIVTTNNMSSQLLPEIAAAGGESVGTRMMLSTTLVPDTGDDSMVYNNLIEIVQSSNTQGRRMKYSIVGNQQMADQSLTVGTPVIEGEQYTKADLVTPKEVDADSSQKVLILPPTGSDKNYTLWVIIGVSIAVLLAGSVIFIKKFIKKDN